MADDVRFAIIGLGMGRSRARTVAKTSGARLQVVCDVREERARSLGEELGCDWTVSLEQVLARDDVDVVDVMLPSGMHGDVAIQAMRSFSPLVSFGRGRAPAQPRSTSRSIRRL